MASTLPRAPKMTYHDVSENETGASGRERGGYGTGNQHELYYIARLLVFGVMALFARFRYYRVIVRSNR